MDKEEFFKKFNDMQSKVTTMQEQYWYEYTNVTSWQFWVMLAMVVIPLIVLYFKVDRSKIFLILFYGLNVHVWFAYIDMYGTRKGFWEYPHSLTPFFPFSFSLDASLVPVSYLLVYQWTLNKEKNFYLYTFLLSAFFAFILKPILTSLYLFKLNAINFFQLFLLYCTMFLIARVIVNIVIYLKKEGTV